MLELIISKVRNFGIFSIREFAYNGHLQSIGASGVYWIALSAQDLNTNPWDLVLLYLVFQTIFLYDRYSGYNKDQQSNKARSKHLKRYFNQIPGILLMLIALIVLILFTRYDMTDFYICLTILILGVLYPVYFKNVTKKVFLFKNFYVSLVYGILIFTTSALSNKVVSHGLLSLILFAVVFIESMITQIILDTKDTSTDKKDKLLTLPVVKGNLNTFKYIYYFVVILLLVYSIIVLLIDFPLIVILVVLITIIINFKSIELLRRNVYTGYFLIAGKFSIWFVVLFFAKLLFK